MMQAQICGNRGLEHWLPYVIDGPVVVHPWDSITVNTYWYIVRDAQGNGALSEGLVDSMVQMTRNTFASHGIRLVQKCDYSGNSITEIRNTVLYEASVEDSELCLFTDFCAEDGLNIFILDHENEINPNDGRPRGLASAPGNLTFVRVNELDHFTTICHEIGHCFGLYHTNGTRPLNLFINGDQNNEWSCDDQEGIVGLEQNFGSCDGLFEEIYAPWELVNGSNSAVSGDYVLDTPADIALGTCLRESDGCSLVELCEDFLEDNRFKDPNCAMYSPDWSNFMRPQSEGPCINHFSEGQGSRMRGVIDEFLGYMRLPYYGNTLHEPCNDCYDGPDNICFPCTEIPVIDYHVDQNETFNVNIVHGTIYVEQGATLSISSEVEFSPVSSIVVMHGGRLILDGGKLTSGCTGQKWQGVKVAGELNFLYSSFAPGEVEVKNGATIEKAVIGIDGTDRFMHEYTGIDFEYGGGIVTMDNSTIQYCDIGIKLAPFGWHKIIGWSAYDERSVISGSSIKECEFAIYSKRNLGLEIMNTTFDGNGTDYEGYGSTIEAEGNTFTSFVFMFAEFPVAPGSLFTSNNFVESLFGTESQGNFTPLQMYGNSFFGAGSGAQAMGEVMYDIANNDFYDVNLGCVAYYTGDNIRNLIRDNAFYRNTFASSAYGENDMEYLTNCFEDTYMTDIEIYDESSIHIAQGLQQLAAGNCFEPGARMKTGTGTQPFTYWTKDGYYGGSPPPHPNCKYPGSGNFNVLEAFNESDHDLCGTGEEISQLPDIYQNCNCYYGDDGCKDAIAVIREEIALLEENQTIDPQVKAWLIAKYEQCIDDLMRRQVKEALSRGEVEETITYLSGQPEFRYRIMAYGIMNHNMEYDRSKGYLDTLQTAMTEEQEFVSAQQIYLEYIIDIDNYVLSAADSATLRAAGEGQNPLAGYARSVFYLLTGEKIPINLPHLDGSITPRSSRTHEQDVVTVGRESVLVHPNPSDQSIVEISLTHFDPDSNYRVNVFDAYGGMLESREITGEAGHVTIGDNAGVYLIVVATDDRIIGSKRIMRF